MVSEKRQIWCLINQNSLHKEIGILAPMVKKSPEIAIIHRIDDQIEIFRFLICVSSGFVGTGQVKIVGYTAIGSSLRIETKVSFSIFLLFSLFFCLIFSLSFFNLCYQLAFKWFTNTILAKFPKTKILDLPENVIEGIEAR